MEADNGPKSTLPPSEAAMNGIHTSPVFGGFRHHMPPISNLTRNSKIAQSKASMKQEMSTGDEATLHAIDTGKVIKMDAELKHEISVLPAVIDQKEQTPSNGGYHKEKGSVEDTNAADVNVKKDVNNGNTNKTSVDESDKSESAKSKVKNETSTTKSAESSSVSRRQRRRSEVPPGPNSAQQDSAVTPAKEKRKSDINSGSVEKQKSIFEVTPVEGKRHRKPKVLDIDSDTSPKGNQTPEIKQKIEIRTPTSVEKPAKWVIGDMLWAKVGGHPWWPCMVAHDPHDGLFTKMKARSRCYHVQFFGDEKERGWIGESSIMEFHGEEKFHEHVKNAMENAKKGEKGKLEKLYRFYPGRQAAWEVAVGVAEEAFHVPINDRKQKYTFEYVEKAKKTAKATTAVNGNLDSSGEGSQLESEKSKSTTKSRNRGLSGKKRKRGEEEEKEEELKSPDVKVPKAKRSKTDDSTPSRTAGSSEGSFEVFYQKHRESELQEHPEFDEETLTECLKQQWCMMSQKQKSRYKSKFSADQDNGASKVSSPRVRKPSARLKEAEEGNKVLDAVLGKRVKKTEDCEPDSKAEEVMEVDSVNDVINCVAAGAGDIPVTVQATEEKPKLKRQKSNGEDTASDNTQPEEEPTPSIQRQSSEEYENEIFKLSGSGPVKKENLCQICEDIGQLLECNGPCQGFFHAKCLGISSEVPEGTFKCDECQTGRHTCFACKKRDSTTKKCSVPQCGKFYHEDCVNKLSYTRTDNSRGFICPLHICETCAVENPKGTKATKGRLLRCIRCPTAYHVGDFCIAAGSENLAGYNIVCSKHFQPIKTQTYHTHINVSWCFVCNLGGSLLCCESCPAAFHAECLKISPPEGNWFCQDCSAGKQPLYGDIIWIKLGSYRWWPAEICHPRNVPLNIQEKIHQVGEFPVRFFGSHDYFWIHKGRAFAFQDGDKGSREHSSNKYLAKVFAKGVKEASEAYRALKAARENKEQIFIQRSGKKPAPFKFVKVNVPVGNVQLYKADLTEIPRCECRPDSEAPCSSDTDCLNRMLMYECHPQVCVCGEKCANQRFQKRQYPESEPFKTEGRGWGLKTLVDIQKGQFVNEYVGELIDEMEVKRRIKQAHEDNICNFYMLTLDKNRIIDAGPKGNLSRFMNHCCQPNCETQKWTVNGDVRVGLFALHDIPSGSELTFNYNLECLGNDKTKCNCGAENCSGFLGVRPKTAHASAAEKKKRDEKRKKKRKRNKTDVKKEHDDECFRCGEGGELVMCDRTGCPKVYHLHCLKLSKPPHGKWDCPWHHCDVCGKPAVKMCSDCPNSFCQPHIDGNILETEDGLLFCSEHDDTEVTSSSCASSDVQSESEDAENKNGCKVRTKAILKENLDRKRNLHKKDRSSVKEGGNKKSRKSSDSRKSNGNNNNGDNKSTAKGGKSENPLAVAPMFDDSDDEFADLVIDIPAIP